MRNSKDLRSKLLVRLVDERVWEAIEVVDPQAEVPVRPAELVLNEQVADPLKLGEERFCNASAGVFSVVDSRVTKLCLGFRMKPVAHERRAFTLAKASLPGTMAILPERASSRLDLAS